MPSLDTLPMPLDAMRGPSSQGLDEFRVTAPSEIHGLLRQLADGNVMVNLSTPDGAGYTCTVWALEPARGLLCLSANAGDPQLQGLLDSPEVVAVAYLDSVKLQFDLHDLVLVHGHSGSALNTAFPQEVYRFQRRAAFRVKPLIGSRPEATLRHPAADVAPLALRVIDVSISGIALFLPSETPPIEPGTTLQGVRIDLDGDTSLHVRLSVHHVTQLRHESNGVRLGCEMVGLSGDGLRALQRYIDQTQKRRRLLTL